MSLDKVNEAYKTFRNTHSSRKKAEEEKNKYASGSAQRAFLERQVKIFDDLEWAQFEYLKLTLDEFWNDMKEIYGRWEEAGEQRSPLREPD